MAISKYTQPDMTTMDAATYKAALDASIHVLSQLGAGFAPRAEDTPSMKIVVDPGALFNKASGTYIAVDSQTSTALSIPTNNKITRFYINEYGELNSISGTDSTTPSTPNYPTGALPICKLTLTSISTNITNSIIEDERVFYSDLGVSKNSFLITTSTTFYPPNSAKMLRITACGGGGGGGGGSSAAADATKYGGGGGGGGASVLSRPFYPEESLSITIGVGGTGGNSATTTAAAATAGASATATTVTGNISGASFTCNGGAGGAAASAAANGTGGAGGTSGTGVAGTAGSAGITNTNGGNGGGTGIGGFMSLRGTGAILANTRIGSAGIRGSGGGGGCGYTADGSGKGGNGGDGFVLIEVF